jgi:Kelch motif
MYNRGGHACSTLPTSRMSAKESIIVAGGWNADRTVSSTVQILDEGSNEWRSGPKLPSPIAGAAMVKHPGTNDICIWLPLMLHGTKLVSFNIINLCDNIVKEALLKGKVQYCWPPCTKKFRSTTFSIENRIYLFYTTSHLNEEVNCTKLSPSVSVPAVVDLFPLPFKVFSNLNL